MLDIEDKLNVYIDELVMRMQEYKQDGMLERENELDKVIIELSQVAGYI